MSAAAARLTETAARLFAERGFSRVGINEIIREADVARMSLYNNFASKEDLALAAYSAMSEARLAAVDAAIEGAPGPREAILAVFELARDLAERDDFRGCAFLNLAAHVAPAEDRLSALVRDHKHAIRSRFAALAGQDGHEDLALLGRQLLALWDGAFADAHIEGATAPVEAARAAAERLLERRP
jgi:AcrR family transcriptional regulator